MPANELQGETLKDLCFRCKGSGLGERVYGLPPMDFLELVDCPRCDGSGVSSTTKGATMGGKYPDGEITEWTGEWLASPEAQKKTMLMFFIEKACDWQRHQDAEICLGEKVDADATGEATDFSYNVACDHCAHSVRHSIRAEAKAKEPQCKCDLANTIDRYPICDKPYNNDANDGWCWNPIGGGSCGHDRACHIVGGEG